MRGRVLLGLVGLCLLLWGIKAIRHALQPKYQGKTAQEWFATIRIRGNLGHNGGIALDDPAILAFQNFGPDAARFLWAEMNVRDSPPKKALIRKAAEWTDGRWVIETSEVRNFKALVALRQMGSAADCLVPELLIKAQGTNAQARHYSLILLGDIQTRPELAVPFFLSNLSSTNDMDFRGSMGSLKRYGPLASNALPALEQALTLRSGSDRLLVVAAMVGIGDTGKLSLLLGEVQNVHSPHRTNALYLLQSLKTNAMDAVPALLAVAKSASNNPAMQSLTVSIIESISPGAAKAEGLVRP